MGVDETTKCYYIMRMKEKNDRVTIRIPRRYIGLIKGRAGLEGITLSELMLRMIKEHLEGKHG